MIPSEYGSTAPTSREVVAKEVRDDEPAALVHLRPLERPREELQLGELDVLVDILEDLVHVRPGLDELRGKSQSLGRRVRVLKAAGVGDECGVERLGQLGRQLDAELDEDVAQQLSRRGRFGVDDNHVAEARVVVVVVDVERERRQVEDGRIGTESALVRTVDGNERPFGDVGGQFALQVVECEEAVFTGEWRRPGEEHHAVLAERPQCEVHGEQ